MVKQESLEDRLAEVRATIPQRFSPQRMEIVKRLLTELEESHVAMALDVGDQAPDFTLKNTATGADVSFSSVLANGPAVLSFYRGQW